ncbi:MAG: DNA-binding response regulator, partial [Lachnospiraceae bacterium]
VFLSAYSDFSYARQAIRLRAMDYLTKPYQKEELFAVMEEAIHQAKQNMQNPEYQKKCAGDTAPLLDVRSFDEKDGKNFDISEGVWEEDSDPQISKVVTYEITHFIEQNYMHEISMQDAAQFMHYSDTYFCKLFKQGFGCNFTTYLTQYRIERAEQLLRTTDLSVREVALRTGYGDSNYFTKVFKRKTGIVPSEYRAQQRKI